MEEQMLESQTACHIFLCSSQSRPTWNWPIETWDMPKQLEIFYVVFLTASLYIQCDQFIIFQVTLPIPPRWVPSNVILGFKRLHLNLLKKLFCWPSDYLLEITLPDSEQFRLSSNLHFKSQLYKVQGYCGPNCLWPIKTLCPSDYFSALWSFLAHQYKVNVNKMTPL